MHDEQRGATSFAPGERATADRIRGASPTDEVLSRAGDAINSAMAADAKAPIPQLHLANYDGDVVHGGLIGGYKVMLRLDGVAGVLELPFPSSDRAEETAEALRDAVSIVNRALRFARDTFTVPLPEPVDCIHAARIEEDEDGERIAVCRACTTVLVHNVAEWAAANEPALTRAGFTTIEQAITAHARGRRR